MSPTVYVTATAAGTMDMTRRRVAAAILNKPFVAMFCGLILSRYVNVSIYINIGVRTTSEKFRLIKGMWEKSPLVNYFG